MLETIRLGKRAKNQLVSLKRKTGIANWNILCRWAFALSIVDSTCPRRITESLEDGIEMTWRTFGGEFSDVYEALLKIRCLNDHIDLSSSELSHQLRYHISRGIGYLAAGKRITNIGDLAALSGNRSLNTAAAAATSPNM